MAARSDACPSVARLIAIAGLCVLSLSACAEGAGGDQVEFAAVLNGVDVATSKPNDPIELVDDEPADLQLTVQNVSGAPLTLRYIRFEGTVLDLTFLTYDTAIRVDLAAGETREIPPVLLDFFDLGGQASGVLRGHVQLYDEQRDLLGSEPVFLDADGDGFSTLSTFNLVLLLATVSGLGWNLYRLAQRRLPANRFLRAVRFFAVGVGAGLTLSVGFSTLRLWPLDTLAWVLITVIGGIIGYAVGFLLPGADDEVIDVLDEQDVLDAVLDSDVAGPVTEPDGRTTIRFDE